MPSATEILAGKYQIDPQTGCWMWRGKVYGHGYGRIYFRGSIRPAHRVSYELTRGPITEGLVIDHLCDRPGCINPDHLRAVTQRENLIRSQNHIGISARKTHCDAGHLLSGENLYMTPNGRRQCRTCRRAAGLKYWRRKHARHN